MILHARLAIILLLLTITAPGAAAETHGQDLRALWDQAQRSFPGLQASRYATAAAQATADEQSYLRLPGGEVTAYLTGSPSVKCQQTVELVTDVQNSPVGGQVTFPASQCLSTNANLSLTDSNIGQVLPVHGVLMRIDLKLTQPLFTFGKLKAARELGRVGVDVASATAGTARAELGLNLVKAYYGVKASRAGLATARDASEQITAWVKRVDRELEKGHSSFSEIDLARLKLAEAQVGLNLADLERTEKSALRALRYLVQDESADIDDEELAPKDIEEQDLGHYLDQAMHNRPELKIMLATGRGAALYRKLRIAEFLPDLAVMGTFNYGLATAINDNFSNGFMNRYNYLGASLGLVLRQPLDFGPRVARLQKAQADLLQFQARRRELLGGGMLEIERAFHDVEEARTRLKLAEASERRARGWLQGVKQAIDVGTAESRDMVDALRSYFDQHGQVLRTINDLNVACATLRRLSGMEVIP